MGIRFRSQRYMSAAAPDTLDKLDESHGLWYESAAEVRAGLARGEHKAALLGWVRYQMTLRLTLRECQCIELHYFEGLTFSEVGARTRTHGSSACRAVQRGIAKLRDAAREAGLRD